MGQVSFFCSTYFEFWLLSEVHNAGKESQVKNTLETRIVKTVVDKK